MKNIVQQTTSLHALSCTSVVHACRARAHSAHDQGARFGLPALSATLRC